MTISYNLGIPASLDNPSTDQPNMLTNTNNIATYVAVDHAGFNTAGSGEHEQVSFFGNNIPSLPTPTVGGNSQGILFTNTVGAGTINQLFYYAGSAAQSSAQYNLTGTPGTTGSGGSTFLLGGLIVKWGIIAATDNTSISFTTASGAAFPNNCLGVNLSLYSASASSANAMILSVSPTPSASAFTPRIRTSSGTTGSATIFYIAIGN